MNLSVALATFNGGRFLPEQLASIAAQTRPPDELVVSDDASRDDTADVVRHFAATAPFPVRLNIQPANVGTTSNFEHAIRACSGDVIALCDQDDVWRADKLERLEHAFRANPDAGLVFSDADVVGEDLHPLGHTLWEAIGFGRAERQRFRNGRAFECLLRLPRVTGATAAFRAGLRDLVLPIPRGWFHDEWIGLVASAVAGVVPIDEPLIRYRQHPDQQVGGRRRGWLAEYRAARNLSRKHFVATAHRFAIGLNRLSERPRFPPNRLALLAEKVAHCRARAAMREPDAFWPAMVWREWASGRYRRFSRGWKAAVQDLFLG